jgi:hypothetical protein
MKSLSWASALSGLAVISCACTSNHADAKASPDAPAPASSASAIAPTPSASAAPQPDAARDAPVGHDAAPAPLAGQDFIDQARVLFRLAACGGDAPIPARFDAKTVEAHCKDLTAKYAEYKRQWVDIAMPYIANLEPKGLPQEVVYPFGGSDLMSALATFPDGLTYTTISLEASADIRRVDTITQKKLDAELALNRLHLGKLFEKVHSRTVNLDMESKSDLPGEIVFSLVALAIYGFEPVSLRYFRINADGTLHYLTAEDIDTMEKAELAKKKSPADIAADVFGAVELQFRKAGDPSAPLKTFRHMAWNLDDKHLRADPSILRHLEAKGKVSAMTKAASHCLWSDEFSTIRQYLLDHMVWMISDSTGIPIRIAKRAGWTEDTYGVFEWPAAFFVDNKNVEDNNRNAEDMRKLWKQNPQHDLAFRYGYPDRDHHAHMMVTRPASSPAPAP